MKSKSAGTESRGQARAEWRGAERGGRTICPPPTPIRVCAFDQSPLALEQLSNLLAPPDFQLVKDSDARAGSPAAVQSPLVLVLDEKRLALGQWPFLQMLRGRFPAARLLALGENSPQGRSWDLLRSVHGFVLYADASRQLAPAVRALAAGRWWFPEAAAQYFAQSAAERDDGERAAPFTRRETQIIELLEDKLPNKEIAARLKISERTVKFHLRNVYDKLGVEDRRSAAAIVDSWYALKPEEEAA